MVNDKTKTNVREFKQSAFTLLGGHEPEDSAMPGRRWITRRAWAWPVLAVGFGGIY